MSVRNFAGAMLVLGAWACPIPAHADGKISYQVSGNGCALGIGTLKVKGKRLRWDTLDGSSTALFDGFENTLIGLDHKRRQQSEMDIDYDALDYKEDVMASADRKVSPTMRALAGEASDKDCAQLLKELPRYEQPRGAAPMQIGNCEISADGKHARATHAPGMFSGGAIPGMTPQQMEQMQSAMHSMSAQGDGGKLPAMSQEQMQAMMAMGAGDAGLNSGGAPAPDRHRAKMPPVEADFEHPAIVIIPAGGVMGSMSGMLGRSVGKVRVEALGAMQEFAGIKCTPFERYLNDELLATECWAKNTDLPLDEKDIATLTEANIAAGMMQNMGDQNRASARRSAAKETLVMRECTGELGKVQAVVEKGAVDESVFEIPAGYRPALDAEPQ